MKTYLVVTESVVDYEKSTTYQSFISRNSAVMALNEKAKVGQEVAKENEWESMQNDQYFETYEDGYFAQNHYTVELLEIVLEGYIDQKVDALKKEERERFLETAADLEFTKREDGREVYTLPEEDEDGYDPRPIILVSYDDGADNVRVDAIIRKDDYYQLECSDTQSFEDSCFDLDDIECGHLDYLTNSL